MFLVLLSIDFCLDRRRGARGISSRDELLINPVECAGMHEAGGI